MRIRRIYGLIAPVGLALAASACAQQSPRPPAAADAGAGAVTAQMRSGSLELRKYQIDDWIAPDDRTLVINAADRSLYEARFKGRCTGLRNVDTIAFIVPGALQVDQYAGVVLPDGTRCAFASVTRLSTSPATDRGGSSASQ